MSTEARLRALVEHSLDILCILSTDGCFAYANPAIRAILGWREEDLLGSRIADLVHPEDFRSLQEALAESISVRGLRFRHADGRWIFLETAVSRHLEDPEIQGFVVNARDRSERRRAREALRSSEEKYRRLFEESRDTIYIGTLQGELLDINAAGVRLFEYESKEEMLSLDIGRDLYWNPPDRKGLEDLFTEQGFIEDAELELKTRTGKRLRVRETASPVFDEAGNIVGFRGIVRDVTDQRQVEEQLRQSQKMEAVGRLAGGVAHDFNNLLTAINGYSELVLARLKGSDPIYESVSEIRKAGKKAADLTRRLLTLSRHQVVAPRRLSLNQVVLEMEKLLRRVLSEDIELETRLEPGLDPIYGDQAQIEQVLLNLSVNARDAMPSGGRLLLETSNVQLPRDALVPQTPEGLVPGPYVRLTVGDTGTGMDREIREKLFEPFFTTKEPGHNSGLGLAMVYSIVKQARGHIEVDSQKGTGTRFQIYFPRLEHETARATGSATPSFLGNETILLVEDEEAVRALVRHVLELKGYRVLQAASALQALAICDSLEVSPDLLLTDVVMPERSGTALAEDLERRYDNLKILFISGYTDSHSGVRLITERRAAFLPKPFTPEELASKVRTVLDQS